MLIKFLLLSWVIAPQIKLLEKKTLLGQNQTNLGYFVITRELGHGFDLTCLISNSKLS